MKLNLLATTFSSLLIASASFAIPEAVLANKALINRIIITPVITRSTVIDDRFILELSPSSQSIQDLEISLPQQLKNKNLEDIRVTDKSGEKIKTEIQKNQDRILISFTESVKPETALRIKFTDIDTQLVMGQTLLYRLSIQQEGLLQRIPVGTARFNVPDAS